MTQGFLQHVLLLLTAPAESSLLTRGIVAMLHASTS